MKRMKQKGGISAGTWREYLILAAVMLPLTFCVSCGQTELPPVNNEDSSDISIAHIIEEEPEENSSEVTGIALPVESSALLYVNQRLGFTIEFPVEWAGLIQLEEEFYPILEDKQLRDQLYAAVMELPDKQAKWIFARFYLGMTVKEIAKAEGVDLSWVYKSIKRGLKRLGKNYKNFN